MKTNALRKLIKSRIDTVCKSYYRNAIDDAMYPHVVFDLQSADLDDYYRTDYTLMVDVWAKNNQEAAEQIADDICDLFNAVNLPQSVHLPTFYRENRRNLPDEDKDINHIMLEFSVQDYDR